MGILATTMCEEKARLEERLLSIMHYRARTRTAVLLSSVLLLVLAGCSAVSGIGKAESPGSVSARETMTAQEAMDALEDSLIFLRKWAR
jgi:hypothetical protein